MINILAMIIYQDLKMILRVYEKLSKNVKKCKIKMIKQLRSKIFKNKNNRQTPNPLD